MDRMKWIPAVTAFLFGVSSVVMSSGCTTTLQASSRIPKFITQDDGHVLIDVPEFGFMFESDKWWVAKRFRRAHEIVPVVLQHQIFSAQVLVTVLSPTERPLLELAWEARRYEMRGDGELPELESGEMNDVEYASFAYHIGIREDALVQERITFARAADLPEFLFVFYGAWPEEDEDELAEQMENMVVTLRPIPQEYLGPQLRSQ